MSNSTQNDHETHTACIERIKKEGASATCCHCNPHDGCTLEMKPAQNNEPIINGEWGSPAPYKVNRWVKKDSTQNDWAKKLSSLIDDTIENRHDYKGSLVVEDDILFERLNENLKLFVTTLLADARREIISKVEKIPVVDSSGLCDLIAKDDVLATLREEGRK